MNEFYEVVRNFLEELRCDSEEREFVIVPADMKEAKLQLEQISDIAIKHLEKLSATDKKILDEYLEALEHCHFKEEQRAYYQGIMDGIQLLGALGLIKKSYNLKNLIENFNV